MTEKLARMGFSAGQEYEANTLKQLAVTDVMARDVATIGPQVAVREAADRFSIGDLENSRHQALPIVDSAGRLRGIVTQGDLIRAQQVDPEGKTTVLDAGSPSPIVAYPDERVFDAVTKMLENNIGRLPVVERANPEKLVGYINRAGVMSSWRGHLQAESVREHGWFGRLTFAPEGGPEMGVATGRVVALSGDELRLSLNSHADTDGERFALRAPAHGVFAGDVVRIRYRKQNGDKIAVQIEELDHWQ